MKPLSSVNRFLPGRKAWKGKGTMLNYFLPGINEKEKESLKLAKVAFCDLCWPDRTKPGVVIAENELGAAMLTLGLQARGEDETTLPGVVLLKFKRGQAVGRPGETLLPKVVIASFNGNNVDGFKALVERALLPVVKRDIMVTVPHGSVVEPVLDDRFYVHIWSAARGDKEADVPSEMWGIDVDCTDDGFSPTGRGQNICDDTGQPVGELVNRSVLYIFHDAVHEGSENELAILEKIFEEVALMLEEDLAAQTVRREEMEVARDQKALKAYVDVCMKGVGRRRQELQENLQKQEEEVEKSLLAYMAAVRNLQSTQIALAGTEQALEKERDRFADEFRKVKGLSKIERITAEREKLCFFTEVLYCKDPRTNKEHEIGAFRIELYFGTKEFPIRWFNTTRQVDGYKPGMHAPHVFPDGKACLGNSQHLFTELWAKYEVNAMVLLAIQFIESVNTSDGAGEYIERWPVSQRKAK